MRIHRHPGDLGECREARLAAGRRDPDDHMSRYACCFPTRVLQEVYRLARDISGHQVYVRTVQDSMRRRAASEAVVWTELIPCGGGEATVALNNIAVAPTIGPKTEYIVS